MKYRLKVDDKLSQEERPYYINNDNKTSSIEIKPLENIASLENAKISKEIAGKVNNPYYLDTDYLNNQMTKAKRYKN